ncbi:MAG: hypothetical protein AAF478_09760 [Pseudomonadota bacterium]
MSWSVYQTGTLIMLYWKNKPIDSLSKAELQQALQDSLPIMMGTAHKLNVDKQFSAFITGTFFGLILAGGCIAFTFAMT